MSDAELLEFPDRGALDDALAAAVADQLAAGIEARGRASLAVSGGSTPKGVFARLARTSLAWDAVTVTLVDERWVKPTHADSNERLTRENLLTGGAAAARFVPLYAEAPRPEDALGEIAASLTVFDTFDSVMLGMGADGHFASLFPGSASLDAGLDLDGSEDCIAVDPPVAPHARMSLTLARIINTRQLVLQITGDEKRTVLELARRHRDPQQLPIAAVLALSAPPLAVYWSP
ncbi:MAG: 6-phosphogluconolactonase [Pseudomonadota bacterium]